MANPGIITEQGYAAGSFGFTEASEEDAKKISSDDKKKEDKKDKDE